MKNILCIQILFFLVTTTLQAQKEGAENKVLRKFATQAYHQKLLKENPSSLKNSVALESKLRSSIKRLKVQEVTIPVVFHVLYNKTEERISVSQIMSQIDALNRDFMVAPDLGEHPSFEIEGFDTKIGIPGISFCLAEKGAGVFEPINYIETKVASWSINNFIKEDKNNGVDPINPQKILNIWIGNLKDEICGYAQMPGGPNLTDGIVIDYRFVGIKGTSDTPYNEGKTLTHLVGNYLGLHDLWSEYGYCKDDYVADTPIHNSQNYGCYDQEISISLCSGNPVEMTMNFMDNTNDACMKMFTYGQMVRMHGMLVKGGPRGQLVNGKTNCKNIDFEYSLMSKPRNENELNQKRINVLVFPNPANSVVNLRIDSPFEDIALFKVVDALGRRILIKKLDVLHGVNHFSENTNTWPNGLYLFQVDLRDKSFTYKVVIADQSQE